MGKITFLKNINKLYPENKEDTTYNKNGKHYHSVKIMTGKHSYDNGKKELQAGSLNVIKSWMRNTSYTETLESTWEYIFPIGGIVDRISKMLTLAGIGSLRTKAMYTQVWLDTKPIEIPLSLYFEAENSGINDVVTPIRNLQKMVVPIERTKDDQGAKFEQKLNNANVPGFLKQSILTAKATFWDNFLLPPAAATVNLAFLKNQNSVESIERLEVGEFIQLRDIILENISVEWDLSSCDAYGFPLKANVEVKFKSRSIWTDQTILSLMNNKFDVGENGVEVLDIGKIFSNIIDGMKQTLGVE